MIRTLATLSFLLVSTSALAETATPKPEAQVGTDAAKTADSKAAAKDAPPAEIKSAHEFTYAPKDTDMVYGKESAPVTLVEYASLSCPHCAQFYRDVFPELQKKYLDTGKVKLVYRNYPLNQPALEAAQMVQCADPSTRATYVKVLFTTQEKWAYDVNFHESLAGIAVLGGMERKKFDDCLANKDIQSNILLTYQEARDKFKVASTPTLFIDNKMHKGNHGFDSISKALDEALAAAPKK